MGLPHFLHEFKSMNFLFYNWFLLLTGSWIWWMQHPTSHEEITEILVFATSELQHYLVLNCQVCNWLKGFTIWKDEAQVRDLNTLIPAAAAAICTNPTPQSPFQDQSVLMWFQSKNLPRRNLCLLHWSPKNPTSSSKEQLVATVKYSVVQCVSSSSLSSRNVQQILVVHISVIILMTYVVAKQRSRPSAVKLRFGKLMSDVYCRNPKEKTPKPQETSSRIRNLFLKLALALNPNSLVACRKVL